MQDHSLQEKVISGAAWKFSERIFAQGISLVVSIILARILDPAQYGVIGIVNVYFAFANIIISGGLNTALIQKKDAENADYSSVFTLSIIISVIIYVLLFFLAKPIASIYEYDNLATVIRVLGLSLPIYAAKSIVCAHISANLNFKTFFLSTSVGTAISGIVGIVMAYNGCGVWALVCQQLTNTVIDTCILYAVSHLKLQFKMEIRRIKSLFSYGFNILISSIINTAYAEITPLFIGLKYTPADLAFYTKGSSWPGTLSSSISGTLSSVLFPALSKCQDDKEKLLNYTRLYIRVSSYIVFPVLLGFFAVSEKLILLFLTESWLPAVYYARVFCISAMFDVVAIGNCETIKAMGRSDIFLRIEIIKKSGFFITLALFLIFTNSPEILILSKLVCTIIQVIVNSFPNRTLLGYTLKNQVLDLIINLILSIIMCVSVMLIGTLFDNILVGLLVQIAFGIGIYLILSYVTQNSSFTYLINIIRKKVKK